MVKILLDPSMYHPHLTVAEELQKAADLGYQYIELSPRADFHEWHHYPKVDDAEIARVKKATEAARSAPAAQRSRLRAAVVDP